MMKSSVCITSYNIVFGFDMYLTHEMATSFKFNWTHAIEDFSGNAAKSSTRHQPVNTALETEMALWIHANKNLCHSFLSSGNK